MHTGVSPLQSPEENTPAIEAAWANLAAAYGVEQPARRMGDQRAAAERVLAAEALATTAAVQNAWTDYQRRREVVARQARIGDEEESGLRSAAAAHSNGLDAASARLQEVLASGV